MPSPPPRRWSRILQFSALSSSWQRASEFSYQISTSSRSVELQKALLWTAITSSSPRLDATSPSSPYLIVRLSARMEPFALERLQKAIGNVHDTVLRTSCKFGALLKVSVAVQATDGINSHERIRPSATVAFIQSAFILAASTLCILCPISFAQLKQIFSAS